MLNLNELKEVAPKCFPNYYSDADVYEKVIELTSGKETYYRCPNGSWSHDAADADLEITTNSKGQVEAEAEAKVTIELRVDGQYRLIDILGTDDLYGYDLDDHEFTCSSFRAEGFEFAN